ncbi:hypothetical protein B0H14DRAFT_2643336 [Mycena olivaceomarginata]|nr:hypothetical protein B0H14DRAFT_2643336 [Mycena olivaceomarginata]
MATVSATQLAHLLKAFNDQNLPISRFLVSLLAHSSFAHHNAVNDLLNHTGDIMAAFLAHPNSSDSILHWANSIIKGEYAWAIRDLVDKENGWHFVPTRASMEKLELFEIEENGQRDESDSSTALGSHWASTVCR